MVCTSSSINVGKLGIGQGACRSAKCSEISRGAATLLSIARCKPSSTNELTSGFVVGCFGSCTAHTLYTPYTTVHVQELGRGSSSKKQRGLCCARFCQRHWHNNGHIGVGTKM